MVLLERRTTLTDDGAIAVLDQSGQVTAKKLETWLGTEFKAEKPWLFEYKGAGGSGSRGSGQPPAGEAASTKRAAEQRAQVLSAF
jgi:hypothetical protein